MVLAKDMLHWYFPGYLQIIDSMHLLDHVRMQDVSDISVDAALPAVAHRIDLGNMFHHSLADSFHTDGNVDLQLLTFLE